MGRIRDEDKPAEIPPDQRRQRQKLHSLRGPERTGECPLCGTSLFGRVRKCPNCGCIVEQSRESATKPQPVSATTRNRGSVTRDTLGASLIALAVFATLMAWVWVARLSLLQAPMIQLAVLAVAVMLVSGVLVYRDAKRLGVGRTPGGDGRVSMRPLIWALGVATLYPVAAPAYFLVRTRHGSDSPAVTGVVAACLLTASVVFVGLNISSRSEGARREAQRLTRESEWIMNPGQPPTQ